MVIVLIGESQLERVGQDAAPVTIGTFEQVLSILEDQRFGRHCGWGERNRGCMRI